MQEVHIVNLVTKCFLRS